MFLPELRYAFRTLAKDRGFTLAAVLSLALGIGGNVAMFSLVNAVLLKPLPYREPEQLVLITEVVPKANVGNLFSSLPVMGGHVVRWRNEIRSFESVGAVDGVNLNLTGAGQPERLGGVKMTAEFLDVLGIRPQLGRWFLRAEEVRGAPDVVILSDSLWRRRFFGDQKIVGRKVLLDGKPYEVVGVTPPGMLFIRERQLPRMVNLPEHPEVFIPLCLSQGELDLTDPNFEYTAIARVRRGVALEQARAEIEAAWPARSQQSRWNFEIHARLEPLLAALVGNTRKGLLVLLGAVGFVLLIVCVNVANLTLVRATHRRRELAIRTALGAGKRHLAGQSLVESAMLAMSGTLLGLLMALWIMDLLIALLRVQLPRLEGVALDRHVLAFAVGLCLLTTILFGMLPALCAAGVSPQEAIQSCSRGNTDGPRGGRLRAVLVSAEVALSTLLLIGAGLLLSSLQRVMHASRGFQSENIVSVDLSLPSSRYETMQLRTAFFRRLSEAVHSLPGVLHAGYISSMPLSGEWGVAPPQEEGKPPVTVESPMANWVEASGGYFPSMGIPLRSGRLFEDQGEKELAAVVSETAVMRVWAGSNPIGKRIRGDFMAGNIWFRVIGVVGDVRSAGLDREPEALIYLHHFESGDMSLVVRTAMEPTAIATALRQQVWRIDPEVPVPEIRTMARIVSNSVTVRRFQAVLVAAFACVALLLASIGIYGVVAYTVTQRRAEIGVRLALGANQRDIKSLTLRQSMKPVATGLGVGLATATILGRLIVSLLFEVRALDPLTFITAPILLLLVATLACYLPARQAARIDPIMALHYE